MTMQELVTLMANKLAWLNTARSTAVASGDLEAIIRLDGEIQETQNTLNTLQGAM